MKIFSLFIVFVFIVSFHGSSQGLTHKRLERLYKKNPDKCLVVAKRQIKYFGSKPSPYYFVTLIYLDKVQQAKSLRAEYNQMSQALNYAQKFEKYSDDKLKDEIEWKERVAILEKEVNELIEALEDNNDGDLAENLLEKLTKLEEYQQRILVVEVEEEVVVVPETNWVAGQYYGLPIGNEMVPSFNVQNEKALLDQINIERKKLGMEPLVWEEALANAARYHAYDMGSQDYFNHDTYDRNTNNELVKVGRTFERIRKFYSASFVSSENIAAGNEQASDTYDQWYTSKGHYDNMFNPESTKVGIGVCFVENSSYGFYWVFCTAL